MLSVLAVVGVALVLGTLGLPLIFTELGPDESTGERALVSAAFYFFAGALVGYLKPRLWPLGILTAWSGLILGFPIALATVGAYLGSLLKGKDVVARMFERRPDRE